MYKEIETADMKRYTPYIFPLVVLGIIFMLVFRWYTLKSERSEYALLGEGVEIENLSQEEMVNSIQGVGDYETVELNSENPDNSGVVRYEVKDDKVRFSVMANLPEPTTEYNVWLRSTDGTAMREVFTLVEGKGGYIGSAALPSDLLPFEVIISEASEAESVNGNYLLRGVVIVPEKAPVEVLKGELK